MKNLTFIFAIIFATSSFAQFDQGTLTFGAGQMFTTTASFENSMFEGPAADVSYFVTDGVMVSLSVSGNNEVTETINDEEYVLVESSMNWSAGVRYYVLPDDGLFAGLQATKVEWQEVDSNGDSTDETGMDLMMNIGLSKELGFDGKLWFEPALNIYMPTNSEGLLMYGLGATFRFAF